MPQAFCTINSFHILKFMEARPQSPTLQSRRVVTAGTDTHGRAQKGGKWAGVGRATWQTESSFRITKILTVLNNRGKAVGIMVQQESRKQNLSAVALSPLLLDLSVSRIQSGWCDAQEASSSRQRWSLL